MSSQPPILLFCLKALLACLLTLSSFNYETPCKQLAEAAYPVNFINVSGCLYAYVEDGTYHVTIHEAENQYGSFSKLTYDSSKSNCTDGPYPGNLVATLEISAPDKTDNNFNSMSLELQFRYLLNDGYWSVTSAILNIDPRNPTPYKSKRIELQPVDMYAANSYSYSCNSLVLTNSMSPNKEPRFKIVLRKFQLQPFKELPDRIFATSYDCAVWLTMPVIMGALLILFIIATVMMGVYLLLEQGNQSSDLKFSKQGGMLLNQAQLDATKSQ